MKKKFDVDHIMWSPGEEVLKKINRIAFKKIGDMNWHEHCGIFTAPIIVAVKFNIPLIIWGETEWDIAGIFGPEDYVEFSNRDRHENSLRGFEWYDFINDKEDHLTEKDFGWAKYPSDEDILSVGLKVFILVIFLSGMEVTMLNSLKKSMIGEKARHHLREHIENFQI